jgi:hypothetical protein
VGGGAAAWRLSGHRHAPASTGRAAHGGCMPACLPGQQRCSDLLDQHCCCSAYPSLPNASGGSSAAGRCGHKSRHWQVHKRACQPLLPAGPACHGLRGGYGCCHRRVALGGHASLLLTFDPSCPLRPPDASFMGSEAAVGQLQRSWEAGGACWDAAKRCCGRCAGQTQGEGCGGACSVRANVQVRPGRLAAAGRGFGMSSDTLIWGGCRERRPCLRCLRPCV